jgi:predicted aldo/keto reductase-like oxidoreductase
MLYREFGKTGQNSVFWDSVRCVCLSLTVRKIYELPLKPCPAGVNIPELFWAYNHDAMFQDFGKAKFWVTGWLKEHERASRCVGCGQCEEHCPQNISIREHLEKIADTYE